MNRLDVTNNVTNKFHFGTDAGIDVSVNGTNKSKFGTNGTISGTIWNDAEQ